MREQCFDISAWQTGINYQAIRDRANYCILRAGYSETIDGQFENHYNGLQGLNLGVYWYSYALNESEIEREAYKCLEAIRGKKFTLPIYLDIEDPSQEGLGRDRLNNMVRTFGNIIENAGYYFGVYSNLNWYNNILSGYELNQEYDWWIAYWSSFEPTGVDYGVWQYTSEYNDFGAVIDGDIVVKDYPTIIRQAGLNHLDDTPTPQPTPVPTPTQYQVGDVVNINGVYVSSDSTERLNPAITTGTITRIIQGARNPYLLDDGNIGWVNDNCIVGNTPTTDITIGTRVRTIATGNGASDGSSNTAMSGLEGTVTNIINGANYPYLVSDNEGALGWYKKEALQIV